VNLKKYIKERRKKRQSIAKKGLIRAMNIQIGVVLRQAREEAGLTQEELARRLKTRRLLFPRIENHAEDIKLSTIERVAGHWENGFKSALPKNAAGGVGPRQGLSVDRRPGERRGT